MVIHNDFLSRGHAARRDGASAEEFLQDKNRRQSVNHLKTSISVEVVYTSPTSAYTAFTDPSSFAP